MPVMATVAVLYAPTPVVYAVVAGTTIATAAATVADSAVPLDVVSAKVLAGKARAIARVRTIESLRTRREVVDNVGTS
jgi:hypothetical protein